MITLAQLTARTVATIRVAVGAMGFSYAAGVVTIGTAAAPVTTVNIGDGITPVAVNVYAGSVTAALFIGDLQGVADEALLADVALLANEATALETARTINGVSFDGTANITITAASPFALTAGAFLTSAGTYDGSVARTFAVDATSANTVSKVVARDASGNFAAGTITASLDGVADEALLADVALLANEATTLETTRTLWGQNFDGSANVSGNLSSVGSITATGLIQTTLTTEQMRLRYDASNYFAVTVNSTGNVSLAAVGSSPSFTFAQLVQFSTDAATPISVGSSQTTVGGSRTGIDMTISGNAASGTHPNITGIQVVARQLNSGSTATLVRGFYAIVSRVAGTVTEGVGVDVAAISSTMGTAYGLRVGAITGGATNYAIATLGGTISFDAGAFIFNEAGGDFDARWEGDALSHLLFTDASGDNIALCAAAAPNFQSMTGGIFLGNRTAAPTGNPANGGFLHAEAGALKWRGSAGTITEIAAA